jgi:stage II sporulation protein D
MKKILTIILLIIFIPYIIVSIFLNEEEIEFKFTNNMIVRVFRDNTKQTELVPFEEYVTGVLAGEMPVSFNMEALKAQAVAARTYVMKKIEINKNKDYDIIDTVANQVYLDDNYLKAVWKDNYISKINKLKTAIIETEGQYLSYNERVIEAFFFSTSVGMTENSEDIFSTKLPYLRSMKSEWDKEVSPVYSDAFMFNLDDFYKRLNLIYTEKIKIQVLKTTSTGRIKSIKINGKTFTGGEIFSKLSIRSTYFSIVQTNNIVTVTTKGYGHGVGMSQYGAEGMARAGYNYEEILKYYYQGVNIEKI